MREPPSLHGVVEGRFVLDVLRVDVDAALDEEAHEVGALHGVDEARAAEVVRLLHVGTGAHQAPAAFRDLLSQPGIG